MSIKDLIFGRLEFKVTDGFSELFFHECKKQKIMLFDVTTDKNGIGGVIRQHDLKPLSDCAEISGMQLEIVKRQGLPDIFFRYRRRAGVPVGLSVMIFILCLLRSFIWSVDIIGLQRIPEDEISKVLSEQGAVIGQFCQAINLKDIEFSLYKSFEDISWVNVTLIGTRLQVSVSEVDVKQEYKEDLYSNIIAAKDGEVVRADIFSGEGSIYPGTAVVKGDLLVSGVKNHRDGSVEFVDSSARIIARTRSFLSSSIPECVDAYIVSGCKDIYLPCFFALDLAEVIDVKEDYFTCTSSFFSSGDVIFPIGFKRLHETSLEKQSLSLSESQAVLMCFRDFSFNALKLYENADVLSVSFSVTQADICEIVAEFLCEEDIAHKKSFTVADEG